MHNRLDFIQQVYGVLKTFDHSLFNSVVIAQALLESDGGTSELATKAHNYFGIKYDPQLFDGSYYIKDATEFANGSEFVVSDTKWRKYPDIAASVKDHSQFFIKGWRLSHYDIVLHAKSPEDQCRALQQCKYATDPGYAQKLIHIIRKYNLTQYDGEELTKQSSYSGNVKTNKSPESAHKDGEPMKRLAAKDVMKQVYGTVTTEIDLFQGTAGRMPGKPKGVVIHNDYGAMNGKSYPGWLREARTPHTSRANSGFAHYYSDRNYNTRVEHTYNRAYHGGNIYPNTWLIGYEVCESLKASTSDFLKNEEVVFMQVAEDLLYYNLPIDRSTVRLHKEFSSTSCPHRSWDIHLGAGAPNTQENINKLKDYFISRIQYWADVLEGRKPIPTADTVFKKPEATPAAKPAASKPKPKAKQYKLPEYTAPKYPMNSLQVGEIVTIRTGGPKWYIPHAHVAQEPTKPIEGEKCKISNIYQLPEPAGHSKVAYLMEEFNSFILEEDIVEAIGKAPKVSEGVKPSSPSESKPKVTPAIDDKPSLKVEVQPVGPKQDKPLTPKEAPKGAVAINGYLILNGERYKIVKE